MAPICCATSRISNFEYRISNIECVEFSSPKGTQFRCACSPSRNSRSTVLKLAVREGVWGRATDAERKRVAAVTFTSDHLVCWLSLRNESTQISPRPNSLRRTQSTVIGGLSGSLPLPPPGVELHEVAAIDGRGNYPFFLSGNLNWLPIGGSRGSSNAPTAELTTLQHSKFDIRYSKFDIIPSVNFPLRN